MNVSIIIVNYNTTNLVLNCITSIIQHTKGLLYEIIIVDNNSNDDIEKHSMNTLLVKLTYILLNFQRT